MGRHAITECTHKSGDWRSNHWTFIERSDRIYLPMNPSLEFSIASCVHLCPLEVIRRQRRSPLSLNQSKTPLVSFANSFTHSIFDGEHWTCVEMSASAPRAKSKNTSLDVYCTYVYENARYTGRDSEFARPDESGWREYYAPLSAICEVVTAIAQRRCRTEVSENDNYGLHARSPIFRKRRRSLELCRSRETRIIPLISFIWIDRIRKEYKWRSFATATPTLVASSASSLWCWRRSSALRIIQCR